MAQAQGVSTTASGRIDGSLGTVHTTTAAFVLGAGWGASTMAITSGSTDQRGELTITCATGGGLAQATATVTMTFLDGAYAAAPWPLTNSDNDNSIDTGRFAVTSRSTTAVVWTFSVLPVNTKIYKLRWMLSA